MSTSAKDKLEALKNAFTKKNGGGNQDYKLFFSFWRMQPDETAVVRFLPDLNQDNPLGFLVEKLQHELIVNGQKKRIACPSMFGDQCPICALSRKYYDEENPEMGKTLYRKKSYIGQVIVVESPIEHDQTQLVKLIDFGPAIFTQIQSGFKSGDLEEAPYELKGGYNFRIKKTQSGQYASYATSSFAPKQTDLDDDIIEQLSLYNLADYRGERLDYATVEAYLIAHQTGQTVSEPAEKAPHVGPLPPRTKPVDDIDSPIPVASKTASVIEQLRARAKAATAKPETAE